MKSKSHTFKYKQVIVMLNNIKMSQAKFAVQVAHGSIESFLMSYHPDAMNWYDEGMRKIVLTATDKEFKELMEHPQSKLIVDFGLTELEPNTITGLTFPIMLTEDIDKITKHLKLYK